MQPLGSDRKRIAILTPELVGFYRNGGIGTCYTNFALQLAAEGHDVHVVLVMWSQLKEEGLDHPALLDDYAARGVRVHVEYLPAQVLSFHSFPNHAGHTSRIAAERLRNLEAEAPFDFIHSPEGGGMALTPLLLKHLGIAFRKAHMVVGIHSPTLWVEEAHENVRLNARTLTLDVMERQSVALADTLWSPSSYLLDWVEGNGWSLPQHQLVFPYTFSPPARDMGGAGGQEQGGGCLETLAFFGRLEPRKGLDWFVEALVELADKLASSGRAMPDVKFLGRSVVMPYGEYTGRQSLDYIASRLGQAGVEYEILDQMERADALSFLTRPGTLAVMPSRTDNSPNTVYECLHLGIPFLAARTGGIPELIHPGDVERATFPPSDPDRPQMRPEQLLAERLECLSGRPMPEPVRPAKTPEEVRGFWRDYHAASPPDSESGLQVAFEPCPPERLCVCMATAGKRLEWIGQAVDSLRGQTREGFGFLMVNDGGDGREFLSYCEAQAGDFERRGWRIVHQENQYVGKARNRAVLESGAPLVLFMDDDNLARPEEVARLLDAYAVTGADIHTVGLRYINEDGSPRLLEDGSEAFYIPAGPNPVLGVLDNCFGDLNFMCTREGFDSVGRFNEKRGLSFTDWVFLAKACLQGLRIQVVPELLIDYRLSSSGISRSDPLHLASRDLLSSIYAEWMPEPLRDLPRILHYAMHDLQGGTCGTVGEINQRISESYRWFRDSERWYRERLNWQENVSNWQEERSRWLEAKSQWLEGRVEWLESRSEWLEGQTKHLESKVEHYQNLLQESKAKAGQLREKVKMLKEKGKMPWKGK